MEHKINVDFTLTTDSIVNILSMEAGGFDYWAELCFEQEDYEAARKRLVDAKKNDPCYEDVMAEILERGGKLNIWDREEDKDHPMTIEDLKKGIKLHLENGASTDMDDWDANDGDAVIQYAAFGEIIYG